MFDLRFDRTDVEHLVPIRIADSAHDQGEDAECNQDEPDELHIALHSSGNARCRPTLSGQVGRPFQGRHKPQLS